MPDNINALLSIIERQKQDHFDQGHPSISLRKQQIGLAIALLQDNADDIIDAVNQDYGFRAPALTRYADIDSVTATLQYAQKHLARWMKPEKRSVGLSKWFKGERAYIEYQPLGSIGVMAPWNGPVALLFLSLAGIFAAGNRVVLKPSHQTPKTGALIQRLIKQYYQPEYATVALGDAEFARQFAAAPFDHLLYTGNSDTGASVMAQAAQQLTPVTLELGGSAPVVIGQTADLNDALSKTLQAKMINSGQICIAPDALYIHDSQMSEVVNIAEAVVKALYPQGLKTADYPAIFSQQQTQYLQQLVDDAKQHKAEIASLLPQDGVSDKNTFVPTLVINPPVDADICQKEIFGPVIRVHVYTDIKTVVGHIRQAVTPLALYYFGADKREQAYLLEHSRSGGVTINDVMIHAFTPNLPFGGVGRSGMGRYGGLEGFRTFSNARAIYRKP